MTAGERGGGGAWRAGIQTALTPSCTCAPTPSSVKCGRSQTVRLKPRNPKATCVALPLPYPNGEAPCVPSARARRGAHHLGHLRAPHHRLSGVTGCEPHAPPLITCTRVCQTSVSRCVHPYDHHRQMCAPPPPPPTGLDRLFLRAPHHRVSSVVGGARAQGALPFGTPRLTTSCT